MPKGGQPVCDEQRHPDLQNRRRLAIFPLLLGWERTNSIPSQQCLSTSTLPPRLPSFLFRLQEVRPPANRQNRSAKEEADPLRDRSRRCNRSDRMNVATSR